MAVLSAPLLMVPVRFEPLATNATKTFLSPSGVSMAQFQLPSNGIRSSLSFFSAQSPGGEICCISYTIKAALLDIGASCPHPGTFVVLTTWDTIQNQF